MCRSSRFSMLKKSHCGCAAYPQIRQHFQMIRHHQRNPEFHQAVYQKYAKKQKKDTVQITKKKKTSKTIKKNQFKDSSAFFRPGSVASSTTRYSLHPSPSSKPVYHRRSKRFFGILMDHPKTLEKQIRELCLNSPIFETL